MGKRDFWVIGPCLGVPILLLAVWLVLFMTVYFSASPTEPALPQDELLIWQKEAAELGNHVASSRRSNLRAENRKWESVVPVDDAAFFEPLDREPSAAVVFVHGYNTDLVDAVRNGNGLCRNIRKTISSSHEQGKGGQHAAFFTFCWRGDLGRPAFPAAEANADVAGSVLAEFLKEFLEARNRKSPIAPVIVIAHSLGSRVALEALRTLYAEEGKSWIDCTLLVQPAVTASSLCTGTYELVPIRDSTNFETVEFEGRYAGCLRASRHWIVTSSNRDAALPLMRSVPLLTAVQYRTVPDIDRPLGSPQSFEDWQFDHDSFKLMNLSPEVSPHVSITDHSPIFTGRDIEVVKYLWEQIRAVTGG